MHENKFTVLISPVGNSIAPGKCNFRTLQCNTKKHSPYTLRHNTHITSMQWDQLFSDSAVPLRNWLAVPKNVSSTIDALSVSVASVYRWIFLILKLEKLMAISVGFFPTHFHKILDWGGEKWAKARTQFKRGQVRQSLRPLGELCHPEFVSSISCCFFVLHFSMTLSPLSPSAVSVYVLKQQHVWNLMLLDFSDQKRSKWAVPAGSGWVPSGVCHLAAMVAMERSTVCQVQHVLGGCVGDFVGSRSSSGSCICFWEQSPCKSIQPPNRSLKYQ